MLIVPCGVFKAWWILHKFYKIYLKCTLRQHVNEISMTSPTKSTCNSVDDCFFHHKQIQFSFFQLVLNCFCTFSFQTHPRVQCMVEEQIEWHRSAIWYDKSGTWGPFRSSQSGFCSRSEWWQQSGENLKRQTHNRVTECILYAQSELLRVQREMDVRGMLFVWFIDFFRLLNWEDRCEM